jgi:hypothetical protein
MAFGLGQAIGIGAGLLGIGNSARANAGANRMEREAIGFLREDRDAAKRDNENRRLLAERYRMSGLLNPQDAEDFLTENSNRNLRNNLNQAAMASRIAGYKAGDSPLAQTSAGLSEQASLNLAGQLLDARRRSMLDDLNLEQFASASPTGNSLAQLLFQSAQGQRQDSSGAMGFLGNVLQDAMAPKRKQGIDLNMAGALIGPRLI